MASRARQSSMWTLRKISTKAVCLFIILITGGGKLTNGARTRNSEAKLRQEDEDMSAVQFLSRWQPDGEPLYHRRLSSQWHDMCAESLGMPKVALCFLTRGNVHQEAFWERWMKQAEGLVLLPDAEGTDRSWSRSNHTTSFEACQLERKIHSNTVKLQHMFTVYTNPTDPSFQGFRPGSLFYGTEVGNRLPSSAYASYDLVEGARSLLAAALRDRLNQRFVHLSESCIPLYPPALIYMQLLHEQKSRVHVQDPREVHWTQGQWKPVLEEVHGLIREQHWRKGDHWRALIRKHAQLAVDDRQLVDALSIDCRDCHVPERYFQMLLALHGLQNETFPYGWLTWADWGRTDPTGWHPWNADSDSVDEELLFTMRTAKMPYDQLQHECGLKACTAAWDDAPLASAQQLLQSYTGGAKGWDSEKAPPAAGEEYRGFRALQHECLLFGRKFRADTADAVLNLFTHPQYGTWNYTQQRKAPRVHDKL